MGTVPDINHSFKQKTALDSPFCAFGVHSQIIKSRELGRPIVVKEWMLESVSGYGGTIYFQPPAVKPVRRNSSAVHLYAPGCRLREDTREAVLPVREIFIRFKGGDLCGLRRFISQPGYCRFMDEKGKIRRLLEETAGLCAAGGEKSFWEVQSVLCRCIDIISNYSAACEKDAYAITDRYPPEALFIKRAEAYMRNNISLKLKNSDIAAHMGISESSFNHKFKKLAGISPAARFTEMKIDAAAELLLKGRKLKNITDAVGIKDEFYLSRIFKRKTGLSPTAFRSGMP